MSETKHVDQNYLPHVQQARACAASHPSLRALLSDEIGATVQLGTLIEFCAIGVRLLRPLEDSLRRAMSVCVTVGFDDLGEQLQTCARQAADRRLHLVDDLVQLAQLWREQVLGNEAGLDLRALVRQPAPAAARHHAALHEATPLDELPFMALGVQIELGEFARSFGPRLLRACEHKLGAEIFAGMSYIQQATEDAAIARAGLLSCLDDLLRVAPDFGELIAGAGAEAVSNQIAVWSVCAARGARLVNAEVTPMLHL